MRGVDTDRIPNPADPLLGSRMGEQRVRVRLGYRRCGAAHAVEADDHPQDPRPVRLEVHPGGAGGLAR